MREPLYSKLLRYALYLVFVVGVVVTVLLSFILDTYLVQRVANLSETYRTFLLPFLTVAALPCLWIVIEMIGMLRSIPKGPFVMRNVRALQRVGVLFFALTLAFILKCFLYFTFLTLFCVFLFVGAGLFSFTLAALIRQAVVFREENDLTI